MPFCNNEITQKVLGALLAKPEVLSTYEGQLNKTDFQDGTPYGEKAKSLFLALGYLFAQGAVNREITTKDVENIYNEYQSLLAPFANMNTANTFTQDCFHSADAENFRPNCQYLKKLSLLRDLEYHGYNVDKYHYAEPGLDQIESEKRKNAITEDSEADILAYVENNLTKLRSRHTSSGSGFIKAGDGIYDLLESFAQSPEIGPELNGLYYNSIVGGAMRGRMYLRSGGTNVGKALPNSTKIPLFDGTWKQVGDIEVGDKLIGSNGTPTTVLAIHPQREPKEIYRVTFGDGHEALCCKDHLWGIYTGKKIHYEVLTTEQLMERPSGSCGIPLVKPVDYAEKVLPLNPYVMGAILGSGSFCFTERKKAFEFYAPNTEIPDIIAEKTGWHYKSLPSEPTKYRFYHVPKTCSHSLVWVEDILAAFPELWNKKLHEKFLPEIYLQGSAAQRRGVFVGLLDAAANISKTGAVSFATTSEVLARQIEQLARSLGLMVVYSSPKPKEGARRKHKLTFRFPSGYQQDYFNVSYKKEQLENSSQAIIKYYNFAWITKVEPTGKYCDMTCFTVDAEDALFCIDNYTITHNTRWAVFDACKIVFPYKYDSRKKRWIHYVDKEPEKVLFITTEMKEREIQSIILAYLSDVDEQHIKRNALSDEERIVVQQAAQMMQLYGSYFYLERIEDPNLTNVQNTVKKHILLNDVGFVFYDYIFTSPSLIQQFSSSGIREDVALSLLSNQLKEIAATYNVFVSTSTQVNGDGLKFGEKRDQRALRGKIVP